MTNIECLVKMDINFYQTIIKYKIIYKFLYNSKNHEVQLDAIKIF